MTNGGHEPIGPNTVDVSGARLCLNPARGDAPIVQVHSAFRVTIENAQIVEANVVLGTLRSDELPTQQERVDPRWSPLFRLARMAALPSLRALVCYWQYLPRGLCSYGTVASRAS